MKLKLSLGLIANEHFVKGFRTLATLDFDGQTVYWLDKGAEILHRENLRFHKLRDKKIIELGECVDKEKYSYRLRPGDKAAALKFVKFMAELQKETVELTLPGKITLPQDANISAASYRCLVDAGVIEPWHFEEAVETDASGAVLVESKAEPTTPQPEPAPEPEPARLPAPVRNGKPRRTKKTTK